MAEPAPCSVTNPIKTVATFSYDYDDKITSNADFISKGYKIYITSDLEYELDLDTTLGTPKLFCSLKKYINERKNLIIFI